MHRYLVKRLLLAAPTIVGVSLLVFGIIRLIPGDIALILAGPELDMLGPGVVQRIRADFGLDQPVHVQYYKWVGEVARGNMGYSLRTREPVLPMILAKLPLTVELCLLSTFFSALAAVPLGVLSAMRSNSGTDFVSRVLALLGLSLPNFWVASMLLLISSIVLGWYPSIDSVSLLQDPLTNLSQMLMPVITLSIAHMAVVMRMTRSSMLEVLHQDYIQTAHAKGLSGRTVVFRHALKNAFIPVITVMGIQVGHLLGGTIVIEQVFGLPGIGWLLVNAIYQRDYPVVQGTVLFIALMFLVVNLVVDVIYTYLDPRIRYS